MKVTINRENDAVLFKVENATEASAQVDGSPEIGGVNGGLRPMEMLLGALATCSAFEVVTILRKQRQDLQDLRLEVQGHRPSEGDVKPFTAIDIHFLIAGKVEEKRAQRAVALALEKYCSVSRSLHPDIEISSQISITNQNIAS